MRAQEKRYQSISLKFLKILKKPLPLKIYQDILDHLEKEILNEKR